MTTEPLDPQYIVSINKFDDKAVENLRRADKAAVLAPAGPLLHWLQDGNWPVAMEMSVILNEYTNDLKEELLEILRGTDGTWKLWCINCIIDQAPEPRLDDELLAELRRLGTSTTYSNQEEGAAEAAQQSAAEWEARPAANQAE